MSPSNTTERALEESIEKFLSGGISGSELIDGVPAEDRADYNAGKGAGYVRGSSKDFIPESALDTSKLWEVLEATQPDELAKLYYKPDWKQQIIERLHR